MYARRNPADVAAVTSHVRDMAQLDDGNEVLVDVDLADELSDGLGHSIEPGGWYSSFFLHSDSGTSVTRGSWASSPLARVSMRMTGLTPRWCHASIMTSCISPALPMRYSVLSLAFLSPTVAEGRCVRQGPGVQSASRGRSAYRRARTRACAPASQASGEPWSST